VTNIRKIIVLEWYWTTRSNPSSSHAKEFNTPVKKFKNIGVTIKRFLTISHDHFEGKCTLTKKPNLKIHVWQCTHIQMII